MNFNQQTPFEWANLWDVVDDNVRASINPTEGAEGRRGRGGRRGGRATQPDEFADYWASALREWGAPWMNLPMHGGPPHRGPHPPPPGRSGPPPPPPPPGHEGPHPPPSGRHGPPPPPPGPRGPPPPRDDDDGPSDPPSRSPTPPTPPTPPEELPEYPGLPHEQPHHGPSGPHHPRHCHRHHPRHGKGKGPEGHHDHDKSGEPSHHPWHHPGLPFGHPGPGRRGRRHRGPFGGPRGPRGGPFGFESWNQMFPNGVFAEDKKTDTFEPQYEVFDKSDKVVVFVSLAGAKKENVDVAYDAPLHSLTISGVVTRPEEVDEEMFALRTEGNWEVGYFRVVVDLPAFWGVVEDIKAKMEDGVLRVEVGKPGDEDWEEVRKVRVE